MRRASATLFVLQVSKFRRIIPSGFGIIWDNGINWVVCKASAEFCFTDLKSTAYGVEATCTESIYHVVATYAVSSQVDVIIVEMHRTKTPWGEQKIASVQFVDKEDGWVSHVVPIPFSDLEDLRRKIAADVAIYLARKAAVGKNAARRGLA